MATKKKWNSLVSEFQDYLALNCSAQEFLDLYNQVFKTDYVLADFEDEMP